MSGFREQALEKLEKEYRSVTGNKQLAMREAVRDALREFVRQDEEFAQAVVQGGSLGGCLNAVAKDTGSSISDLQAYRKAVQYYFPGAEVRFTMQIDLAGAADTAPPLPQGGEGRETGILLDFTQFL